MTRTISFIIGIAVVALVAVPTALGSYGLGDSPATSKQSDGVTFFWANERATMGSPESPAVRAERLRSEGLNKLYGLGAAFAPSTVSTSKRVVEPQSVIAERLRSEGMNKRYGLGEFASTTPVAEPVTSSGTDVEWSQVGIGVGIGLALAIALGLSLRATTHNRPLAH